MVCEICNKEFEEKYFDVIQNKCILHSEKDANYPLDITLFNLQLANYIKKNKKDNKLSFQNIYFPYAYNITKIIKTDFFPTLFERNAYLIIFYKCHFHSFLIMEKQSYELQFEYCIFKEQWEHIFSKQAKYLYCTFDKYIHENLSEDKVIIQNLLFFNCGFKSMHFRGVHFIEKLFKFFSNNEYHEIVELNLINCEFDKDIIFNSNRKENDADNFTITKLDFSESTFKGKVKIQFCEIENANFYNTKFEDLADFYQTKFKNVNFERTDFKGISVFSETEFMCNVDFKYTKFLGKAIFRDTVITGILDLRNSIFDDEANFLDITSKKREKNKNNKILGDIQSIHVANRETARVIKNFYDESNNIIEANRFYALEMEEREKELQQNKTQNFMEWLVFKAHKISSNHSQDWFLSLFWIINLTFFYSSNHCIELRYESNFLFISFLFFSSTILLIEFLLALDFVFKNKYILAGVCLFNYILYSIFYKDYTLDFFSNQMNPFSIMTGKDTLNLFTLIYKSSIAYLIYQFIISVRQNTKRK